MWSDEVVVELEALQDWSVLDLQSPHNLLSGFWLSVHERNEPMHLHPPKVNRKTIQTGSAEEVTVPEQPLKSITFRNVEVTRPLAIGQGRDNLSSTPPEANESKFLSEELDGRIKQRGYWRVVIRPNQYRKERLTPLRRCQEVVEKAAVSLRGRSYPYHVDQRVDSGLDFVESLIDGTVSLEHWRMYQSGQFTNLLSLREDTWPLVEPMKRLEILNTLYSLTEFYEFISRLGEQGLFPKGLALEIGLHNVRDRILFSQERSVSLMHEYVCRVNDLSIKGKIVERDILGKAHEHAVEHTLWIFERFGWTGEQLSKMLQGEQEKFLKGLS